MKYDPNRHHRRSIRLKGYDYSTEGGYYITICVQNRECLFGDVIDGVMHLNEFGKIVDECWRAVPDHFPNVELDEFVVMPNHFHGIMIINESEINNDDSVGARSSRLDDMGATQGRPYKITLGKIVAYFKYESTKRMNAINDSHGTKIWQRNYYEHIIRDEKELIRIREYIYNNPARWPQDEQPI